MSLLRPDPPPPTEAWEDLREWANHSWWHRFRASVRVMLPIVSLVVGIAAIALFVAEPSWRSARWVAGMWAVGVFVTGLGYMRRMNRAAAQVPPITAASSNPTTAVDIRGNRERTLD